MKSLDIPSDCKKIDNYAFSRCVSLKQLILPNKIQEMNSLSLFNKHQQEVPLF